MTPSCNESRKHAAIKLWLVHRRGTLLKLNNCRVIEIDTEETTATCQIRGINNYSDLFTANSQQYYALYTDNCRFPIGPNKCDRVHGNV